MKTFRSTRISLNVMISVGLLLCLIVSPTLFITVSIAWTVLSLSAVGVAYQRNFGRLFRKKSDGRIPLYIRWIFFPFLLGINIYNYFKRKFDTVPPIQKISDSLFVGARLSSKDTDTLKGLGIDAVLDVTAEFDGLGEYSDADVSIDYLNIPILDHAVPNEAQIAEASRWIHDHRSRKRNVLVHCALGRGRSVLFAATYLISIGEASSLEEAMGNIQGVRMTAKLNRFQTRMVTKWIESRELKPDAPEVLYIIANPAAGGGKWGRYKQEVLTQLQKRYDVKVLESSLEVDARQRAQEALAQGARTIVACGGDGTLSEVVSVVVNTPVKFGFIPCGTANSVALSVLGWESKLSPVGASCDAILNGQTQKMDCIKCNDEYSLLIVALGLESDMIRYATREEKDKYGCLAYCLGFINSLSKVDSSVYSVSFDGKHAETIAAKSLVIANAAPPLSILAQGNGEPDIGDGLLDVTIIHETGSTSDNVVAIGSLIGTAITSETDDAKVDTRKTKSLKISSDSEIRYIIDGEPRKASTLSVDVLPKSITIFSNFDEKYTSISEELLVETS